jgi:hypothetical protein
LLKIKIKIKNYKEEFKMTKSILNNENSIKFHGNAFFIRIIILSTIIVISIATNGRIDQINSFILLYLSLLLALYLAHKSKLFLLVPLFMIFIDPILGNNYQYVSIFIANNINIINIFIIVFTLFEIYLFSKNIGFLRFIKEY